MNEHAFYFVRDRERLFGILHDPVDRGTRTGFVLSHPFAEEKLWSHRVFVSLARALTAKGHPVMRFDYTGAGDSTGTTSATSFATHVADLAAAVDALAAQRPELERIGLIGLRVGATVAARLAESAQSDPAYSRVRGSPLVLWDPVLDGSEYFQDLFRSDLSAQLASHGRVLETRDAMRQRILDGGIVNVDGYEIGRGLLESFDASALLANTPKRHDGGALVAAIMPPGRPAKPRPELEALAASYPKGRFLPVEEYQFWREIKQFYGRAERLQSATLHWLETHDD